AACVIGTAVLQNTRAPGEVIWKVGSTPVLFMTKPPAPRPAGGASRRAGKEVGSAARGPAGGGGRTTAFGGGASPGPTGQPQSGSERLAGRARPESSAKAAKPPTDVRFLGFMTVFPMVVGSALCMLLGSLLTRPPSKATLERYFPGKELVARSS